jgi:hypothetical protein
MSIPGSLLSALLPSTLPAAQATAKSLVQRAAQTFGDLLHPPLANGPSEPKSLTPRAPETRTASSKPTSVKEGVTARLSEWLQSVVHRLGWQGPPPAVTLVSDGVGVPKVESAPRALAGPLQESLSQQVELIQAINQATRERLDADPLQWLPGHEPEIRWILPGPPP